MASGSRKTRPSFVRTKENHDDDPSQLRLVPCQPLPAKSVAEVEQLVRAILKLRRKRDELFRPGLFGEPAWDMLLELFLAKLTFRKECVSSLCVASAVPATTAIRWIVVLEGQGLVERQCDRFDRRRNFVVLTEKGQSALEEFFNLPQFDALCASPSQASAPKRSSGHVTGVPAPD